MANFMCPLGCASVQIFGPTLFWVSPKKCFWMRLTFKLVDFEWSRLLPIMWLSLIQATEGLNRAKIDCLQGRRNSARRLPFYLAFNSSLSLQIAALLCRFWICISATMWADSSKVSLYIHIHILLALFLWVIQYLYFFALPYVSRYLLTLKFCVEQPQEWTRKQMTPQLSFQIRAQL